MDKINVVSCEEKIKTESLTVYLIKTNDDLELDCFSKLSVGEHEGQIVKNSNPQYNDRFNPKKSFRGAAKDYKFEKRRVSLECAVSLLSSGKIDMDHFVETRDKFFNYLNS